MFFKILEEFSRKVFQKFKNENRLNNSISQEITAINLERLFFTVNLAILVSFVHIVLFYLKDVKTENELNWKWGVIFIHSFIFISMSCISIILLVSKNNPDRNTNLKSLPFIIIILILFAGIALVAIDQYVTTNITPFIVICVISALVFFIPPLFSIIFYISAYGLYYFAIAIIPKEEAILLTNRVNGVSIIGIGICISLILWQSNRLNIFQKWKIEKQQIELLEKNRLLEAANRELKNLSILDELTQIFNRRYLNFILENELIKHTQSQNPISLIICDVDFFKNYNDRLGHLQGDQCLKRIANLISESIINSSGSAIRFGGEEFVVILPNTDSIGAMAVANRIKNKLSILSIPHPDSLVSNFVTLSFGISTIIPTKETTQNEFLNQADLALFESKRGGRNQITLK